MVGIRPLKKIWMDGRLVDWDDAKVHVLTHGLHYGYAIFEGIRCHETPKGSAIFRLSEHNDRFLNSAKVYRMKMPYSRAEIDQACIDVVRANGVPTTYLRPIAFSGYGEMGLDPTKSPLQVAVINFEWGAYLGEDGAEKGIRATVSGPASTPARFPRKRNARRTTRTARSRRWRRPRPATTRRSS